MKRRLRQRRNCSRRGILLPVVTAVAVLWAFAALQFSESMLQHASISTRVVNEICVRQGMLSSLGWLQGLSELPDWNLQTTRSKSPLYLGVSAGSERFPVLFSITRGHSPIAGETEPIVPGLDDESSKLDINWLASQKGDQRGRLLLIPGMTPALADSLLDWLDSDHEPREFGAERNYYLSRNSPVLPPNGSVGRLADLLPVRGITKELLFGLQENSTLEERSFSGQRQSPTGFSGFLTTKAAEAEYRKSNLIPVNTDDLRFLFEELSKRVGEEGARFVVAARIAGLVERSSSAGGEENVRTLRDRLDEQLRSSPRNTDRKTEVPGSATGLDVSRSGQFKIYSPWELLGTHVRILMDGQDVVLNSPWEGTQSKIPESLKLLSKHLDFRSYGKPLQGRLNVLSAPEELLAGLPGLNAERARKMVSVRERVLRRVSALSDDPFLWLITEDILSLDELRKLSRWITSGGDILTGTVHVFSPDFGPVYRSRVRLDRTTFPSSAVVTEILSPLPASRRNELTLQGNR